MSPLHNAGAHPVEDASGYRGWSDQVHTPATEAAASAMLQEAHARRIPVTMAGAGTGVTGGRVARGGRLLSLAKLTRVEIGRGRAQVGAGVLRSDRHAAAAAAQAALLIEDDREPEAWADRIESSGALAEDSWFGTSSADRERFRRFRHALPELVNDLVRRRGFLKFGSDFAAPLARNREMLACYRTVLCQEFPDSSVLFGHIGDAHLHANLLPSSKDDGVRASAAMLELARHAVALGGTVSAEHGLGKRKAHLLELQYQQAELDAMKDVKRRLDPRWLLGRGTLFPAPEGEP